MKFLLACLLACFLTLSSTAAASTRKPGAFVSTSSDRGSTTATTSILAAAAAYMEDEKNNAPCTASPHPFSMLPGDPSLILTTNVDLGDKKLEIMKACSKAIQSATGKPESYIAVSINDNASVIFGGTDAPTALGCLYSIGSISMESNGQIQASVTDLLEPFGVSESRIYINFFDMPRANVGWSRKTFAG